MEDKEDSFFFFASTLCSALYFLLSTMPPARRGRPALRRPTFSPAQDSITLGPEPTPTPTLNDFFQEFMKICIKKVQDQAPAASVAPAAEAKATTSVINMRTISRLRDH